MKTNIEWATHVWNPVTGCNKISDGCKFCYAERMHKRLKGMGQPKYAYDFNETVVKHWDELDKAGNFPAGSRVFVNSMSDLFHEQVGFHFVHRLFLKMMYYDNKTYIILTKRAETLNRFFMRLSTVDPQLHQILKTTHHIWIGVSVENQKYADERIPFLLKIPMPVKILSCEPLLGSLRIESILNQASQQIKWVIAGGESGHGARPVHPDWVVNLMQDCKAANVPFFFKQWGEWVSPMHLSFEERQNAKHHKRYSFAKGSLLQTTVLRVGKKRAGNKIFGTAYLQFPCI